MSCHNAHVQILNDKIQLAKVCGRSHAPKIPDFVVQILCLFQAKGIVLVPVVSGRDNLRLNSLFPVGFVTG